MWQIARVYSLFLDWSQIEALSRRDKDVVAAAWFAAKALHGLPQLCHCAWSSSFETDVFGKTSKLVFQNSLVYSRQNSAGVSSTRVDCARTHTPVAEEKLTRPINLGVIFV